MADLATECREIVDSAPEGLSDTQRVQTLGETADALEGLEEPDVPAVLSEISVSYVTSLPPRKDRPLSRATRMSDALGVLEACLNALDEIDEEDLRHAAATDLRGELDDAKSEAEGCEFPGMFG
jgi:hypothetical protein